MPAYLLSDIHLERDRPQLTDLFVRFLQGPARTVDAVYLLGDIFEVWIGDDDPSPLVARIADEIRAVVDSGTPVFFMHGNRDFLLGQRYAQRAGMQLLEDPVVIELGGVPTLLAHGDIYCTDDTAYQAFRRKSRSPDWQRKVLGWPLWRRRLTARVARYLSKRSYQKKIAAGQDPLLISDVAQNEIVSAFQKHGVTRMIHGHTHRPNVHRVRLESGEAERIVLGDWGPCGDVLEIRDDGSYARMTLG